MNKRICKQIGLRWIFEALSNGDLDDIPVDWFCDDTGKKPELERNAVKLSLESVKKELKNKDHIIVGHNLFTDLIFLYKTFFGPLPTKVTDFQEMIHGLFPTVMDTKYLHTEGDNAMSGRANLKEILEPLLKIHKPLIVLHEEHTSYGATLGREHEAGFDSTSFPASF
jgi:poly(A)-specific ribonuclease